jgi:predicted Kef-type K+ transport protein
VVTNWRAHYYANSRKIFLLFGLTFAIDLVDTALKGFTYFGSLGPLYYGSMLMHISLCAIAAITKWPLYHGFFALFYLIYNLGMLGNDLLRLM